MNRSFVLWMIIVCLVTTGAYPYGNSHDSVLLQDVKALTFTKGQYTAARRSSPIPQLNCVGGSASYSSELSPSSVQCVNVGVDSYGEVQWKCEADLDSSVKFGETVVSCEGYSNSNDPYVLRGSCGLEYKLEFTAQGRQNQNHGYGGYSSTYNTNYYPDSNRSFSWGNVLMFVIFGFIIIGLISQCSQNAARNNNNSYADGYCPPNPNVYGTTYGQYNPWRPGFWSGFGTGGLLGYFFRPRTYYGAPTYGYGYNRGPTYNSWGSSGGSYFGGSTGGGTRTASAFASTKRR